MSISMSFTHVYEMDLELNCTCFHVIMITAFCFPTKSPPAKTLQ